MAFAMLSAFGALARELHTDTKTSIRSVLSSCIIATFTGTIVYFVVDSIDMINANLGYAFAGICGWIGPIVLDQLSQFVMDKAGLNIGEALRLSEDKKLI
jgi:hypothetical protein